MKLQFHSEHQIIKNNHHKAISTLVDRKGKKFGTWTNL